MLFINRTQISQNPQIFSILPHGFVRKRTDLAERSAISARLRAFCGSPALRFLRDLRENKKENFSLFLLHIKNMLYICDVKMISK